MIRKGWLLMANKIVGNPTVTPMAVPDWNQTDSSKADYIKNKPDIKHSYAPESEDLISGKGVADALKNFAPSGSDSPITVLDYYPSNEQLEEMGEGIYLADVGTNDLPNCLYFFNERYDHLTDSNGVGYTHQRWIVTIIGENGIRVERKDSCINYTDGRADVKIDWREVPLNDYTPTIEYVDEKIKNISPGGGGGVTSYNDLTNKPITVLNYYPTNEQLVQMGEGIYYAKVGDNYVNPDYLYFYSTKEDWITYDGVECKHQFWTITIISLNGVRVERKDNYRAFRDGRESITIDWREVPLNENTATKEFVRTTIADMVDSAPETLDTLNEIATALGNDPNFSTTILNMLSQKANTSDLSKVATSGSYDDLLNQPITVLECYPSQDMVDAMTHGAYVYRSQNHTIPSIMVIAGIKYDEITDDLGIKKYFCRQYIIDSYSGFQARERIVCEDPSYETGWEKIPISDDLATKKQISDILDGKSIVGKAENDDEGNKIRDTYARKDEIQNNLNIVHDINVVEGDEEFDAVPSVRGLKIALIYNATDVVGYVDRSLENIIAKYGLGGDSV